MNLVQLQDHLHKLGCAATLDHNYRRAANVAREALADLELLYDLPNMPVGRLGAALRNLRRKGCYVVIDSPADGTTSVELCHTKAELATTVAQILADYGNNNTFLADKISGYMDEWAQALRSGRDLDGWTITDEAGGMHIEIRHFPDF